jgi:hypothetical protein
MTPQTGVAVVFGGVKENLRGSHREICEGLTEKFARVSQRLGLL